MKDRAVRRQQAKRIIKKRLKTVKGSPGSNRPDVTGKTYYEKCAKEPHRLVKKHPFDCGNPKCLCCHSEKVFKKEKISDLRKKTGLENQFIDLDDIDL